MQEPRPLALVYSPQGLDSLPPTTRVLPLSPQVVVPSSRRVAPSPEVLLPDGTADRIEGEARRLGERWWQEAPPNLFVWESVNLASCFESGLRFVARDLLKSAAVVTRLRETERPTAIATDAPTIPPPFPTYPYLHGIGTLLAGWAHAENLPFHSLSTIWGRHRRSRGSPLKRAYSAVSARSALDHLRRDRVLAAIGAFPESYGPVGREWARAGGSTIVVSLSKTPIRTDTARGMFFAPVEAFLDPHTRREARDFASQAVASSRARIPPDSSQIESGQIGPIFMKEACRRLQEELAGLAYLAMAFERGLEKATAILAMETHTPFSKAAARYARRKAVPFTVLQHGVIADADSYRETETEQIAAWGPQDAEWFRRNLGNAIRVEATGNPRYDALASSGTPNLEGPKPIPIVLFASAPFGHLHAADSPWERNRIHQIVFRAIENLPGVELVVKRHPAEAPEPIPSEHPRVRQVVKGDTFALIRRSSVVLSTGSTVALEAMYLARPSILLGPPVSGSPFCPPEHGGGLRARTVNELLDQIRRLLQDPEFRKGVLRTQQGYLEQSFAPLDGGSSARLVRFLRTR